LEHLATQDDEHALKTKEKMLKKGEFVASYWDRRAQAKYAAQNPGSMLAQGPKPEFRSRYADPNHLASSGNLISLITGGHINPPSRRDMMTQRQAGFGGLGGGFGGLGARREMMAEQREMTMQQSQMGFGYNRGLGGVAARREDMMGSGFGGRAGIVGQDPYQQYAGRDQMYGNDQYQQYDSRGQMLNPNAPRRSMDDREYEQYEDKEAIEQRKSMDGRQRSDYLDPNYNASNYNAYGRQQMNGPAPYGGGFGGGLGGFNAPDLLRKGVKKVLGKVSEVQ
jgi:hypothetical protein